MISYRNASNQQQQAPNSSGTDAYRNPTPYPPRIAGIRKPAPLSPTWKWILIALDFCLNVWLLTRIVKLKNEGKYDTSARGYWATKDGKFYMNATRAQTGEWRRPTVFNTLGYLILINGLVLFVSTLIRALFFDTLHFFPAYSGLLFVLNVALLIFKI